MQVRFRSPAPMMAQTLFGLAPGSGRVSDERSDRREIVLDRAKNGLMIPRDNARNRETEIVSKISHEQTDWRNILRRCASPRSRRCFGLRVLVPTSLSRREFLPKAGATSSDLHAISAGPTRDWKRRRGPWLGALRQFPSYVLCESAREDLCLNQCRVSRTDCVEPVMWSTA